MPSGWYQLECDNLKDILNNSNTPNLHKLKNFINNVRIRYRSKNYLKPTGKFLINTKYLLKILYLDEKLFNEYYDYYKVSVIHNFFL